MRRYDALSACQATIGEDLVVTSLGGNARDWFAIRAQYSFVVHHAMGLTLSVGLGLALAAPGERVWVMDADGGLLMNLGFLGVVAKTRPRNLRLVVFDNETYLSGGGLETLTHDTVDLAAAARACGWKHTAVVESVSDFAVAVQEAADCPEPSLVLAKVDTSIEGPPMTSEYVETKLRFLHDIKDKREVTIARSGQNANGTGL